MKYHLISKLTTVLGLALLFLCFSTDTKAQSVKKIDAEIMATKAVYLGKSRPIRELVAHSTISRFKKDSHKAKKMVPDNFKGRRGQSKSIIPALEHQGPDPLRQLGFDSKSRKGAELLVNFDGVGLLGSPSDPSGEIGKDHYVLMVNVTEVGVYDKSGNLEASFNANTLWSEFNSVSRGDPIVLYDEEYERWILTEFTGPANLLIAVSETSDPLGSYTAYSYQTPNFPDYPKYAIWSEALVVTTNEQGGGTLHSYFIERDSLMLGAEELNVQRIGVQGSSNTEAGFFVSTPVDWSGTITPSDDRAITLHLNDSSWGSTSVDLLELTSYDINFRNPGSSSIELQSIVVTPYDGYPCSVFDGGFSCTPQKDGDGVDAIPEVIMNMPDYRNFGTYEAIVLTFITDVTDGDNLSGIRWMELRRTPGEVWEVYQEGTFAPDDGLDRYMSFISINEDGNIALAYSVSSEDEYVGLRFTGRLSDDPLGLMTFPETTIVDGINQINGGSQNRYGDYGQLSVDPIDGSTFWFTSEWGGSGGSDSRNRVAAFRLTQDNIDVAIANLNAPETSSGLSTSEVISVLVYNRGLEVIEDYTIRLLVNGIEISNNLISDPLSVGESIVYTFPETADLSAFDTYDISVEVDTDGDEDLNNNQLDKTIRHIARVDGEVSISATPPSCEDTYNFDVIVTNQGEDFLSSAQLNIYLNDVLIDTDDLFFNVLRFGESEVKTIPILNLVSGVYDLRVELVNLNQGDDEILSNNSASTVINKSNTNGEATLQIILDRFPAETSWQIVEQSSNTIIYEGGDYTNQNRDETIEVDLCLSPGECYVFTIFDSFGDGISGNGFVYTISNEEEVYVQGNGSFINSREHVFCIEESCSIQAEIEITRASDAGVNDGAILINPTGMTSDYEYSIDGGANFADSNLFENLLPGQYNVVIRLLTDNTCTYQETVTVGPTASTFEEESGISIEIAPNPNSGYFNVNLRGYNSTKIFLDVEIYNNLGQLLRVGTIAKYDDFYTGPFSIMNQPAGTYYIRIVDDNIKGLTRMIKN